MTSDRLGRALRRFVYRSSARRRVAAGARTGQPERLERELEEVRGRVNALFFAVLAVGVGQLVARVVVG